MKQEERDNLLIKLNERSLNTWKYIEDIKNHQVEQNGLLKSMCRSVDINTTWRRAGMSILGGIVIALITKLRGLW